MTSHTHSSRTDYARVLAAVTRMLIAFRDRPSDAQELAKVYADGLSSFPVPFVETACSRFALGKVPDRHNNAFAPSLAEVASFVDGLIAEEERHQRLMNPPKQLPPPPRLSREAAEKGAAVLEAYADELRAETIDHDAEKRREMWKEMGPRIWARFGHDPANPWKPSAELEELIRSKPLTKIDEEAA